MTTFFTILIIALTVFGLVMGFLLIFNGFKPFKDEKGEKIPLTSKEKWVVGILMVTGLLGLISIFVSFDPPLMKKIRNKWNHKAQTVPAR